MKRPKEYSLSGKLTAKIGGNVHLAGVNANGETG